MIDVEGMGKDESKRKESPGKDRRESNACLQTRRKSEGWENSMKERWGREIGWLTFSRGVGSPKAFCCYKQGPVITKAFKCERNTTPLFLFSSCLRPCVRFCLFPSFPCHLLLSLYLCVSGCLPLSVLVCSPERQNQAVRGNWWRQGYVEIEKGGVGRGNGEMRPIRRWV